MDKDHCIAEAKENPLIPLVDSINNDIFHLPSLSPRYCIYRVPIRIRERNPKAYTPQMVSIGPLHHGEKVLLGMEEFKLRCLKAFCDSTHIVLNECLSMIKGKEEEVRNCYAERFDKLDSDSFVKMILLDCCFIIEVFLGIGRVLGKKHVLSDDQPVLSDDQLRVLERERPILNDPQSDLRVIPQVISDIILLENQLPFFIIEDLFNLAFHSNLDSRLPSFRRLSLIYIGTFFHLEVIAPDMLDTEVKHFVDLLRVCFLPSIPRSLKCEQDFNDSTDMPQATEMQEAGMIMRASSSKDRLLDIHHTNGVLQVPKLIVDRKTEELFSNLVALEVCHYFPDTYIIDYLIFMDRLIDSVQDVELLIKRGVIYSLIDDSSVVATLFNNLCTGAISGHNYYYARECKEMSEYCNASWHKWKATLKRDYFSTPWRIASTAAAVILLVLTLIQTIKAF